MALVEEVYRVSREFPKEEIYGLTSQIRRAAVSVASNLSEGAARSSRKEFQQFLSVSMGSLAELETQLIIAARLDYIDTTPCLERLGRVRSLIAGLKKSLSRVR